MIPEQAVTSSSRSGARQVEQKAVTSGDYQVRTVVYVVLTLWFMAFMMRGLNSIAESIKSLKPTITLHEHPTKIEVIQPKPLLPEVR